MLTRLKKYTYEKLLINTVLIKIENILILHGKMQALILETYTLLSGTDVTPKELVIENNNDLEGLEKIKIRKRFNFEMVDISPGDILTFRKDKSITCEVVNETQIRYKDQIMSLSSSALEILRGMDYDWSTVQNCLWCYKKNSQ